MSPHPLYRPGYQLSPSTARPVQPRRTLKRERAVRIRCLRPRGEKLGLGRHLRRDVQVEEVTRGVDELHELAIDDVELACRGVIIQYSRCSSPYKKKKTKKQKTVSRKFKSGSHI